MGFITNQWLKGSVERNRGHFPVKVQVATQSVKDEWSQTNDIKGALTATRADEDYHSVYLSHAELNDVVPVLVLNTDISVRENIALDTLLALDDAELVRFLSRLFTHRKKS